MAQRILRSFSNTTVVNTTSPGYISLDVALQNYDGHTNTSSISCGDVSINSTTIDVGWDGAGNGMLLTTGNMTLGFNILVNTSVIVVGSGNGARIFNNKILVFDDTSNVSINSTCLFAGNSTMGSVVSPNLVSVGNTTVNTTLNAGFLGSPVVMTFPSNVGNLPLGPADGMRAFVFDSSLAANSINFGANVASGGNYHVPVYYDAGSSTWKIG